LHPPARLSFHCSVLVTSRHVASFGAHSSGLIQVVILFISHGAVHLLRSALRNLRASGTSDTRTA
jgi:hypothetical protein